MLVQLLATILTDIFSHSLIPIFPVSLPHYNPIKAEEVPKVTKKKKKKFKLEAFCNSSCWSYQGMKMLSVDTGPYSFFEDNKSTNSNNLSNQDLTFFLCFRWLNIRLFFTSEATRFECFSRLSKIAYRSFVYDILGSTKKELNKEYLNTSQKVSFTENIDSRSASCKSKPILRTVEDKTPDLLHLALFLLLIAQFYLLVLLPFVWYTA